MYSGRCDPLSCVLRRVAIESFIYMLCFVSTGIICKACSMGLVHFTGETMSVSFQKFCSTNGPVPVRVGAWYQSTGSATLGCDLSHAFHIEV